MYVSGVPCAGHAMVDLRSRHALGISMAQRCTVLARMVVFVLVVSVVGRWSAVCMGLLCTWRVLDWLLGARGVRRILLTIVGSWIGASTSLHNVVAAVRGIPAAIFVVH